MRCLFFGHMFLWSLLLAATAKAQTPPPLFRASVALHTLGDSTPALRDEVTVRTYGRLGLDLGIGKPYEFNLSAALFSKGVDEAQFLYRGLRFPFTDAGPDASTYRFGLVMGWRHSYQWLDEQWFYHCWERFIFGGEGTLRLENIFLRATIVEEIPAQDRRSKTTDDVEHVFYSATFVRYEVAADMALLESLAVSATIGGYQFGTARFVTPMTEYELTHRPLIYVVPEVHLPGLLAPSLTWTVGATRVFAATDRQSLVYLTGSPLVEHGGNDVYGKVAWSF